MRRFLAASIVAVTLVARFACGASAASVAEALPPDVIVYLDIPSVPALRAADTGTAYGQIMSEPQVQAFLKDGFPALGALNTAFASGTGKSWSDMLGFCQGEAAIAFVRTVPSEAGADPRNAFVFIADVGTDATAAKDFLDQTALRIAPAWQEEQIPGTSAKWMRIGTATPAYAFVGKYLVISTMLEDLKTVAAGLQSGLKSSLANEPLFVESLATAGVEQPELMMYVNFARFTQVITPYMNEQQTQAYTQSGLAGVSSIVYSSRAMGRGYMDKVSVYCPEGRKGVFAAFSPTEGDYQKYLSKVPADVIAAAWTHMDFPALYDTALEVAKTAAGPTKSARLDDGVSELEAKAGVKLREDLVGSLGKNVYTYTPRPSQILGIALSGGFGQKVTMVELTDSARFEKSLKSAWDFAVASRKQARAASVQSSSSESPAAESTASVVLDSEESGDEPDVTFTTEPFGDKTIYEARVFLGPRVPLQLTPSFAVSKGWLVVASSPQSVKNALSMPEELPANILSVSDYTAAARIVGAANAGATYTDTKSVFEMLYSLASIGLPMITASLGNQVPIEQALLPESASIASHLFGSASAISVRDNIVEMTSYGPIGGARTLYLAGVGGAAIGVWYQQTQAGQRRETRAREEGAPTQEQITESELASIGRGLFLYARSHDGAFPDDLAAIEAAGLLKDESGDAQIKISDYRYVPGLMLKDDSRLIIVFARKSGATGRGVLLVNMNVMNLTDGEVAEQVGGWLDLPESPSPEQVAAACTANLKVLGDSVKRYAQSHDGKTPKQLDRRTYYRLAPLVLSCPCSAGAEGGDYGVVGDVDISRVSQGDEGKTVLVYETAPCDPEKVGVAYLDGSVKSLTSAESEAAIAATKAAAGSQ